MHPCNVKYDNMRTFQIKSESTKDRKHHDQQNEDNRTTYFRIEKIGILLTFQMEKQNTKDDTKEEIFR